MKKKRQPARSNRSRWIIKSLWLMLFGFLAIVCGAINNVRFHYGESSPLQRAQQAQAVWQAHDINHYQMIIRTFNGACRVIVDPDGAITLQGVPLLQNTDYVVEDEDARCRLPDYEIMDIFPIGTTDYSMDAIFDYLIAGFSQRPEAQIAPPFITVCDSLLYEVDFDDDIGYLTEFTIGDCGCGTITCQSLMWIVNFEVLSN